MDLTEEQLQREAALRQAALGRRVAQIEDGRLGPILRRWINADVVPIADALREVARSYLSGDMAAVAETLGTPTAQVTERQRPLRPFMEWALRGASPGRGELKETTYAEDLVLAFMGSIIPRLAKEGVSLSAGLSLAADALRDTVQGQFITSVQGAEAMQRVREKGTTQWRQKRSLQRIAMQMRAQVKPQFLAEERGEVELATRGHRKVLHVMDYKGDLRRLEFLRTPDALDWEIMALCWHDGDKDGSSHPQRNLWLGFAFVILALAQKTGGWFDIVDKHKASGGMGRKHKTKYLQLSRDAAASISKDVERWVSSGFIAEPMLVPPPDGDYLSVKHRKVTGQRPPKGLITKPEGSFSWQAAVHISQSPWRVNEYSPALDLPTEDDPFLALKLAAHRRLGGKDFYLPVNMDFRGRVYYRTPWVTPQSNDLGKSLLRFPKHYRHQEAPEIEGAVEALALHFSSLRGNDKLPRGERLLWFSGWAGSRDVTGADSPLTMAAHADLLRHGMWDCIPVQLDGTCNGLQHLSALMRDEVGAAEVNLTKGGDRPRDIYGKVAGFVLARIEEAYQGTPPMYVGGGQEPWMERMREAGLVIDRSLCKAPVMVLPYGGTREAIRQAVKASVLQQLDAPPIPGKEIDSPWHRVEEAGYSAFRHRALADHPLFNEDVRLLSGIIYECITPAIPKAMAAMETLQRIGAWVGDRALAWRAGPVDAEGMWVVQAKSKAARKQVTLKGFHLPDIIRRLTLVAQTNEVDPKAHKNGIVANFIHSLDAEHLARTVTLFKERGGSCVGTIHDCVMCRPSEVALMHRCLRDAFKAMYEEDPLLRPVRVIGVEGVDEGTVIEYASWHEIAAAAGTSFPKPGTWSPDEVLDSQWFFS